MKYDKNKAKQIIFWLILIFLIVMLISNFKYEYYRTRDLLEDRRVAWFEIPMLLKQSIDNGDQAFIEDKYFLSIMLSIGRSINQSNSDTMVSGKFGADVNERILWDYYNGLSEKIRNIPNSIGEENAYEIEILLDELEFLLVETIEVYEEIDLEVRYTDSRNFLEFDPFKVDTKYINKLYVEKLKIRGLVD